MNFGLVADSVRAKALAAYSVGRGQQSLCGSRDPGKGALVEITIRTWIFDLRLRTTFGGLLISIISRQHWDQ